MQTHIIEESDYDDNEQIAVSMDIYNITICANMTKDLPPLMLNQCLRLCVGVFII